MRAVLPRLCLAAALCAALPACTPSPPSSGPRERVSGDTVVVEVNALAPAFAAKTLDGGLLRLADYVGRHVVLLEFWSIFCKSCIEEMPHIERLHRRYGPDGLAVLSVNTDVFSAKRVRRFLDKAGLHPPYPVVRDPRQEIVAAYGVELLPVTVIIDKQGWIRLYQEGYRPGDERRFEAKVRRLLGQREADDVTLAPRDGTTAFAPAGARLVAVGDPVPPRTGRTVEGDEVDLSGPGPRLLFFWSLYCKPCRADFPELARLTRQYAGRGLSAHAVNVDSSRLAPRVERFLRSQGGGVSCLVDPPEAEGGLARSLGVRATPTVILVDRAGRVAYASAGTTDLAALESRILEVLPEP